MGINPLSMNMANIFSQPVSYLFLFVSDRVFGVVNGFIF